MTDRGGNKEVIDAYLSNGGPVTRMGRARGDRWQPVLDTWPRPWALGLISRHGALTRSRSPAALRPDATMHESSLTSPILYTRTPCHLSILVSKTHRKLRFLISSHRSYPSTLRIRQGRQFKNWIFKFGIRPIAYYICFDFTLDVYHYQWRSIVGDRHERQAIFTAIVKYRNEVTKTLTTLYPLKLKKTEKTVQYFVFT